MRKPDDTNMQFFQPQRGRGLQRTCGPSHFPFPCSEITFGFSAKDQDNYFQRGRQVPDALLLSEHCHKPPPQKNAISQLPGGHLDGGRALPRTARFSPTTLLTLSRYSVSHYPATGNIWGEMRQHLFLSSGRQMGIKWVLGPPQNLGLPQTFPPLRI